MKDDDRGNYRHDNMHRLLCTDDDNDDDLQGGDGDDDDGRRAFINEMKVLFDPSLMRSTTRRRQPYSSSSRVETAIPKLRNLGDVHPDRELLAHTARNVPLGTYAGLPALTAWSWTLQPKALRRYSSDRD